jgi:hypothetical protein
MDTMVRHNDSSAARITLPERVPARVRHVNEVVAGALLSITGIGMILSIITTKRCTRRPGTTAPSLTRSAT